MKILIITNTILSLMACIQLFRTLFILMISRAKINSKKGLPEFLYGAAETEVARRVAIFLILAKDLLLLTWNVSRIMGGYIVYATEWITVTSLIFHTIMFLTAHVIFLIYTGRTKILIKYFK